MTKKENIENPLYPLLFEPIYQYRIWGGRRLANLLTAPLPDGPIGEAWLLSDRDDHESLVANGSLKGQSIGQLFKQSQLQLMGKLEGIYNSFPILLKFLDASEMLSVQVHPSDDKKDYIPKGEQGKTEAWVVLEAQPESKVYVGLKPNTTASNLRESITNGAIEDHLSSFTPKPGDGVFITAGTVHTLGGNVVVFEIQQNSDVTFRLYDWNHIDAKTGQPRPLQIDQAIACIDFNQGELSTVIPVIEKDDTVLHERFFQCDHFIVWRLIGKSPFKVGVKDMLRILVCVEGGGKLEHNNISYTIRKGDVLLLPAVVGSCLLRPNGAINILEIAIPLPTKL